MRSVSEWCLLGGILSFCLFCTARQAVNVSAEEADGGIVVYYEDDDIEYFSDDSQDNLIVIYGDGDDSGQKYDSISEMEYVMQSTAGLGNAGRLFIPSLEIDVGLYWQSPDPYEMQRTCDAWDSAVWFPDFRGGQDIVADHRHQGFEAIKEAVPFQTAAFVKTVSGIRKYICVDLFCGFNTGDDILTGDGWSVSLMNHGGLAMYTCNEDWQHITVTFWQPV